MSEVYNLKASGYQQGYISEDGHETKNAFAINTTNFIKVNSPMNKATIENELCYFLNKAASPDANHMSFNGAVNNANYNSYISNGMKYAFLYFTIVNYIAEEPGVHDAEDYDITCLVCAPDNMVATESSVAATGNPSGGIYDGCYVALWGRIHDGWGSVDRIGVGPLGNITTFSLDEFGFSVTANGTPKGIEDIISIPNPDWSFDGPVNYQTNVDSMLIPGKAKFHGYSEANTTTELFQTEFVSLPYELDFSNHADVKYFRVEVRRDPIDTMIAPDHVELSTVTGSEVWALDANDELKNGWLAEELPDDFIVEPYPSRYWYYDSINEEIKLSLVPSKTIACGAFAHNPHLTDITIPASVTSIGRESFAGTGLTAVTIPNDNCTYYSTSFPPDCVVTGGHLII